MNGQDLQGVKKIIKGKLKGVKVKKLKKPGKIKVKYKDVKAKFQWRKIAKLVLAKHKIIKGVNKLREFKERHKNAWNLIGERYLKWKKDKEENLKPPTDSEKKAKALHEMENYLKYLFINP